MNKNPHKYYLMIEDEVIDFLGTNFPDMTSFISLSLFTGNFVDEEELVNALRKLGLIKYSHFSFSVDIVKRKGNASEGYRYDFVTKDLLFKQAACYLGMTSINSFFAYNRGRYDVMRAFFDKYLEDTEGLIVYFTKKVARLKRDADIAQGKEKKRMEEELNRKTNSLRNFKRYKNNIMRILELIRLSDKYRFSNLELENEYISRLNFFIEGEVNYIYGQKRTSNNRGLVKLVVRIADALRDNPELEKPQPSFKFVEKRIALLKCYERELEGINDHFDGEVADNQRGCEESTDPDSFMFLETDDYERMAKNATDVVSAGIKLDLEILKEKKEKFGK